MIPLPSITRETGPRVAVEDRELTKPNRKGVATLSRLPGTPIRHVEAARLPLQARKGRCGHSLLPRHFRVVLAGRQAGQKDLASMRTRDPLSSPTHPLVTITWAPRGHESTRDRTAPDIADTRSRLRSFENSHWVGDR